MTPQRQTEIMPSEPHKIEVEQALLGAILNANEAYYRVCDFLKPQHFFEPIHGRIYEIAGELIRAGKVTNVLTLRNFIPADFSVGQLNAAQYLARLAGEATGVLNAADYGSLVHDLALRRSIIAVARDALALAYESPVDVSPHDQLEDIERRLFEIDDASRRHGRRELVTIGQALTETIDRCAAAYKADGRTIGVTWGLKDMDRMTGGMHPGELTVLAGRPGMGKSALAVSIAEAAAQWKPPVDKDPSPTGVLLVSPEMKAEALGGRLLTGRAARSGSKVPYVALRDGRLTPDGFSMLAEVARGADELPILIDETPGISIAGVASAVRRAALRFRRQEHRLRLVIVDYLQLVKASDRYAGKRVDEVSEISAAMKQLARDEDVAVLALSQLSREVERRDDKRPMLSDLRDSGSIEQDADSVVFAFRKEYYLQNREPRAGTEDYVRWQTEMEACHGRLDLIIGKQRHGPTNTITVQFDAATNRVSNLVDDDRLPERML